MVQIIGEGRTKPLSTSQKLGRGLSDAFGMYLQNAQQEKILSAENEAARRMGLDLSGIHNPKMRESGFASHLAGKREEEGRRFTAERDQYDQFQQGIKDAIKYKHELQLAGLKGDKGSQKQQQEIREKIIPYQNALSAINEMRQIRNKGNLGILSSITGLWSPETLKDKGKYETLGNSLIQFASNIPIRNRQEFEQLAGHLSDPNITDARAAGILDALESIITGNMNQFEVGRELPSFSNQSKPPLSKFLRK